MQFVLGSIGLASELEMETRKHARFAVKWAVTYSNDQLIGEGTVVNVCNGGCQIAGSIAATVGTRLELSISPSSKDDPLFVEIAEVRWNKDDQFGLEFRHPIPSRFSTLAVSASFQAK